MSYSLTYVAKRLKFGLDLVVVFFSRVGAIGLGMMAGALLIFAILGHTTGPQVAEGSLASLLEGLDFVGFLIGMILLAIGCTIQQRDLNKVRREFGEVWGRGPS